MARKGSVVIFDDYDFIELTPIWDGFVKLTGMIPPDSQVYATRYHDLKVVTTPM